MTQQLEVAQYQAMALKAHAVADCMKDVDAQKAIRQVAQGYKQLAIAARKRSETTDRIRNLLSDDPKLA